MSAISIANLSRRYKQITAVDDLSFTVEPGEVLGLLGPNGSGKTTVVNLINGLLRRDAGTVDVLGHDPQTDARAVRALLGVVPQETNLYEDLSARDNMIHHAALYCRDLRAAKQRIDELLELMALRERAGDPVRTYSGGMKRRLALARALLHDPPVVLFDEPTLGVDVQGTHVLWDHIRSLRDDGKAILVTTNVMHEADVLCDRVLILDRGRCVALDTPDALKAQIEGDTVILQLAGPLADPAGLFGPLGVDEVEQEPDHVVRLRVRDAGRVLGDLVRAASSQAEVVSVRMQRPTLDDVFLRLTGRALRE
ncbi:MAG: ABC transporter ATP-binding protein [Chloroflexi bacterium]|nr:ABC transporter ATP-binding protein [Chloroflexota bacterium]MBU1751808.1 ABC transporter ATP-binding protein [Chloroflexota bacterium]